MGGNEQNSIAGSDSPAGSRQAAKAAAQQPLVSLEEMQKFAAAIKANQLPDTIKSDMMSFEARAKQDGLTPEEVAKTYDSALTILDSSKPHVVDAEQRKILVEQIIHNAAHPIMPQGSHNTCIESELETRLYTRTPAAVANLLQQVSSTAKYYPNDGSAPIQLDAGSLIAHDEAISSVPADGKRGYASQLLQVTAVNLGYSEMNATSAKAGDKARIRYEQHEPLKDSKKLPDDTGERLVQYPNGFNGKSHTVIAYEPALVDDQILEVSKKITGIKDEAPFILNRRFQGSELKVEANNKNVLLFSTSEEMSDMIAKLKNDHNLPAILDINTGNAPFYNEVHISGPHSIGVVDINTDTAGNTLVATVNSWGEKTLHLGKEAIPADQLYAATFDPIVKASYDVLQKIESAKPNAEEEAELLWLKLGSDGYGKAATRQVKYAADLEQTLQSIATKWNGIGKTVDPAEAKAVVETLANSVQFFESADPNDHALDSVRKFLKGQYLTEGEKKVDVWTALQQDMNSVPASVHGAGFFSKQVQ